MPRVWWCPLPVLFLLVLNSVWIVAVTADCWYNSEKYDEGAEVTTAEPCLNCTCTKGVLLCYLRVCPNLPDPPPPGCIILHRYRTCCPELICSGDNNGIEARSDNELDFGFDKKLMGNACITNGSIYGPGSAMSSSSLCEYCYCLGGKQRCVKPKCLLPLDGCTPIYEKHSCCPVHYNCAEPPPEALSTTTEPSYVEERSGCIVDSKFYPEGGKVLGVGHSICDNCYCIRGLLRCEPLSCAPALLGCTPVIKPGECCAASYNCSGVIQIRPEPNYGQYPIVSKEYAKLRKEVQQKRPSQYKQKPTENSNIPFYVIAETQSKNQRNPTTRHFTGFLDHSTKVPYYHHTISQEKLNTQPPVYFQEKYTKPETHLPLRKRPINTKKPSNFPGVYYATTNYESKNGNYRRPISTTMKPTTSQTVNAINNIGPSEKVRFAEYEDLSKQALLSIVDALLDGRINRGFVTKNNTNTTETTTNEFTTETTTNEITTNQESETISTLIEVFNTTETIVQTETEVVSTTEVPTTIDSTTATMILNTTDCTETIQNELYLEKRHDFNIDVTTALPVGANEINNLEETRREDFYTSTEFESSSTEITTSQEDVTSPEFKQKIKTATSALDTIPILPPEIEALINITKNKENKERIDYEYDYNEPTLPPSLPNVRIIPFVAADAVDTKKDDPQDNNVYSLAQERVTDSALFTYTNLFSPPVETEGGFVPKDPPILDNYYENLYHTTGIEGNAVTQLPGPSIANLQVPLIHEHNCISDGLNVRHGDNVPSDSACVVCLCYYGNVVCHQTQCPPSRPGCRKTKLPERTTCCPHYVCDDEEYHDETSNPQEKATIAEGVSTQNPFKDVIRTEPAPDLPSLISGNMPYFIPKTTTTTTPKPIHQEDDINNDTEFSLEKVLQYLLSGEKNADLTTQTSAETHQKIEIESTTAAKIDHQESQPQTTSNWENVETRESLNDLKPNSVENATPVGLLKLAGCNIYGRMYRVGRIISELSGPCLECKCTEVGVQCRALKNKLC